MCSYFLLHTELIILWTLPVLVQFHNAQTNNNGVLTIFTDLIFSRVNWPVSESVDLSDVNEKGNSWYHLGGLISGCILLATAVILGAICYGKKSARSVFLIANLYVLMEFECKN